MNIKSFFKFVEIQTKLASVMPFLLGIVFAIYRYDNFNFLNVVLMFISLIFFDMTTTAVNNYIDYKKAVKKEGYNFEHHNAIVKYNISTTQAKITIFLMLVIAIVTGFSLFLLTDWFVLFIGIISFITGILYSYGPIPISRMPLGEVFSGFFMGFVIFFLTVYINMFNTEIISISNEGFNIYLFINLKEFLILFFVSLPLVITIANIMLANNISDLEDDIVNNRFTLPYYLGKSTALNLFKWSYYIAFIDITILIILGFLPLISLLILTVFISVNKNIKKFEEKQTKKDTFVVSVQNHFLISFSFIATLLIQILFFSK